MDAFTISNVRSSSFAEESQSKLEVPNDEKDLETMSFTSSVDSDSNPPPAYQDAVGGPLSPNIFPSTNQLQIQAIGYNTNQALTGTTMENISVYRPNSDELIYTSIRLKRSSNSCALVRGSDPNSTPLIATIYRWGPGRPPRMRILPSQASTTVENAINSDDVECELVKVRSRSIISRTQKFKTSFGTFEWRYGSRSERKENYDAASLLVLERIDSVSSPGDKTAKRGIRIAQLVRNDEYRTPGTSRFMGGNGGRLILDLSMWADDKKASTKDVEAFVVASCICMLKREADRFRDNMIAAVV